MLINEWSYVSGVWVTVRLGFTPHNLFIPLPSVKLKIEGGARTKPRDIHLKCNLTRQTLRVIQITNYTISLPPATPFALTVA